MTTISVYHIFLILLIFKILSSIVDYKYLIILFIIIIALYYLQENNKIKLNVEILNNINKVEHFEEHVENIYKFLKLNTNVLDYNLTTKKELLDKLDFFINELRMIDNNQNFKYCELYLEKNYDLFIYLNNLFNGILIVYPNLSSYDGFNDLANEFNYLLTNIFKFSQNKCNKFKLDMYKTYDKNEHKNSFNYF